MSRKRTLLPDPYKFKKRCVRSAAQSEENGETHSDTQDVYIIEHWSTCMRMGNFSDLPVLIAGGEIAGVFYTAKEFKKVNGSATDTETSLLYFKNLFPGDKFEDRLPPIIIKHQLYSKVANRTTVDKHINDLRSSGEIKVFKLSGVDAIDLCIVFSHNYERHIVHVMKDLRVHNHIIEKFLRVVKNCNDISLDRDTLMKDYRFKDEEITQLVKSSVLTVRDVGSWWLSIPNAGIFVKNFIRGRKALLTMIRKSKYREILQQELEQRKWPKLARLGILYHIHDVIGADLVDSVQTTSGNLLRLKD